VARGAEGLLAAAEGFDYRLPELFGGHSAEEAWPPVPYPACTQKTPWTSRSRASDGDPDGTRTRGLRRDRAFRGLTAIVGWR
jgi:hypothetical protein